MISTFLTDFPCPCCNRCKISHLILPPLLTLTRNYPGICRITSGYRCHAYNEFIAGAPYSLHLDGKAVDLAPVNCTMPDLVNAALTIRDFAYGGFGWYPKRGIIHLDVRPRPAHWCRIDNTYVELWEKWQTCYPLDPLPKVPCTLRIPPPEHSAPLPP